MKQHTTLKVRMYAGSGLVSIEEVSRITGRSHWTIRRDVLAGRIKCIRLGRRMMFEQSEIRRLIDDARPPADDRQHRVPLGRKTFLGRGNLRRADRPSQAARVDARGIRAYGHFAPIAQHDRAAFSIDRYVQELSAARQERAHVHRCLHADDVSPEHSLEDRLAPRIGQ